ncbi:DNA repair and recombination protein RadB [Methanohalobium sp.]|uniref:DNA repair and recombination protein RadB n=1 Tax=Methanohalobium sp. TaxID=2837493 RepID=UPI0025F9AE26|nr:DNA repair and recombination protein RadB [Methanohalobium sp.]
MSVRLPSGCKPLDNLLGGGFETGIVSQVYGEPGSGKTNLCIQLSVECVKQGKKVIYVDTEALSPDRFKQIAGENSKEIAQNIIIYEPFNFEEQYSAIKDTEKISEENIGLIIVDSATAFYRFELENEDSSIQKRRELSNQIGYLHGLARKHSLSVVITNQIYTDASTGEVKPIGGSGIEHLSKNILQFECTGNNKRRAVLQKHRSRPEGETCEFMIGPDGLK